MGRKKAHTPLTVLLNHRAVGTLLRERNGAIGFVYDPRWLAWTHAIPVSLSLPLREQAYRGAPVVAVFENLLPDSMELRRVVAERVGAQGVDAFNLLGIIGRDCVGALQFVPEDQLDEIMQTKGACHAEPVDEVGIATMLTTLGQAPLGLRADEGFRISLAGAQEKTALLWRDGQWYKPLGATPTTHILKPRIGRLANGIDLSNSVENEHYCLNVCAALGLPVAKTRIGDFDNSTALVVERFDRQWTSDGRLLRLPQEDCCQALGVPPTLKYQGHGGPGVRQIMALLQGSDSPRKDRLMFLKAQIVFWMIAATDGHAKNFSLFLAPGGRFHMTPLYDVLSLQPVFASGGVRKSQLKLAMSIGGSGHYRIETIVRRHFQEEGKLAGLPAGAVDRVIDEVADLVEGALDRVADELPGGFPGDIHDTVQAAVRLRRRALARDPGK